MNRSTIAAIATPYGNGGVGIIRISGDASLAIAESLFRRAHKPYLRIESHIRERLRSHRIYHGFITDPDTGRAIDEVLVLIMKAPKSYTREDVVEIHAHAGHIVLNQILEKVLAAGARIAEPGEFTRRAFLSGRIDLTQAEAVSDIIHAKSATALRMAARQLNGQLAEQLNGIRDVLSHLRVSIETAIDFPEEDDPVIAKEKISLGLEQDVLPMLKKLIQHYQKGHFFRDGLRMAVVGRPNVGKSSLLNCLMERDRAIVTDSPGTTRDVIEEAISVNGLPVVIMDTAGIQAASGEVERIGIARSFAAIQDADLILFVVDHGQALNEEDARIYDRIKMKRHIVVLNKCDLVNAKEEEFLPEAWRSSPFLAVSALKGLHVGRLKEKIFETGVGEPGLLDEIGVVPNTRHQVLLKEAVVAVERAMTALRDNAPEEIVAIDIKEGLMHIDSVLGLNVADDILDRIFATFCIGK